MDTEGGKCETLHVRVERSVGVGVNGEIKIAESAQVGLMVEQQGPNGRGGETRPT